MSAAEWIFFLIGCYVATLGLDLDGVQKAQNLDIGACRKEEPGFCSKMVHNSVCNLAKNECFCRRGYVAVKEAEHVACKTLLTDLKCRVDADCVHVNRSSCHPGAGFCTCPSNTVFVAELNACRTKVQERNSLVCASCRQEDGECFLFDTNDRIGDKRLTSEEKFGCACPNLRTNTRFLGTSRPQRICGAHSDLICRAPTAFCSPIEDGRPVSPPIFHKNVTINRRLLPHKASVAIGTCQCPDDQVPVFQKLLRFFECFPKLDNREHGCESCAKSGGTCYRFSPKMVLCKCPNGFSDFPDGQRSEQKKCAVQHVHTKCENGFLVTCYRPHWASPYESLLSRLNSGFSDVHLVSSGLATVTSASCRLQPMNPFDDRVLNFANEAAELWRSLFTSISTQTLHSPPSIAALEGSENAANKNIFCLQVDLVQYANQPCGIRIYQLPNNRRKYHGMIEISYEIGVFNPGRDMQIPFTCIDSKITKIREESLFKDMNANVTMFAVAGNSDSEKLVSNVREGDKIVIKAMMYSPSGSINVLQCYAANSFIENPGGQGQSHILIYDVRCQNQKGRSKLIFSQGPSARIRTSHFSAFTIDNSRSLFIQCSIQICPKESSCSMINASCPPESHPDSPIQTFGGRINSVDRWIHLNVHHRTNGSGKTHMDEYSPTGKDFQMLHLLETDGGETCQFAVCLTQAQLVTVSVVILIIIVTVCVISLLILHHKKFHFGPFQRYSNSSEPVGRLKPVNSQFGDHSREAMHNCAPSEYTNWTAHLSDFQQQSFPQINSYSIPWMQTRLLKPVLQPDAPSSQSKVNSNLPYIVGNQYLTSNVFIPDISPKSLANSDNQEYLLVESKNSNSASSKCRKFPEIPYTHNNEELWSTVKHPLKQLSSLNMPSLSVPEEPESLQNHFIKPNSFDLQPVNVYEQNPAESVGPFASFLCIQQPHLSEKKSHKSFKKRDNSMVISNNGESVTQIKHKQTASRAQLIPDANNSCTDSNDNSILSLKYLSKPTNVLYTSAACETEIMEHNTYRKVIVQLNPVDCNQPNSDKIEKI